MDKRPGMMIHVTQGEALSIAGSLIEQVRSGDPNTGRPEFFTTDTMEYWSIAVSEKEWDDRRFQSKRRGR